MDHYHDFFSSRYLYSSSSVSLPLHENLPNFANRVLSYVKFPKLSLCASSPDGGATSTV